MSRRLLFSILGLLFVGAGTLSAQTDLLKAYQDRGRMLSKLSKPEQALPYFLMALEMAEQEYGPDSPELVPLLNDLADSYAQRRNFVDAEPLLLRSLDIQERRLVDLQAHAAHTVGALAKIYEETGRPGAAATLYRRILDRWQPTLGPDNPEVRNARRRLAALAEAQEREAPPKKAPPPIKIPGTEPAYLVHITSIRDPAKAEQEWHRLQRIYPDLLAGLSLSVTRVDLKDRGIYYRIHAGPLTKSGAERLCTEIAARGAWCAVVKAPEISAAPPTVRPAAPPPAPKPKPEAAPAVPTAEPTGAYRIHLTSIRDPAKAEEEWHRLQRIYPKLLRGLSLSVERADLGPQRGVYFRIEGGPLSRAKAHRLCAAFAKRDIWCRVVPPPGNSAEAAQRVAAQRLRERRPGPRGTRRRRRAVLLRRRARGRGEAPERACRRVPRRR